MIFRIIIVYICHPKERCRNIDTRRVFGINVVHALDQRRRRSCLQEWQSKSRGIAILIYSVKRPQTTISNSNFCTQTVQSYRDERFMESTNIDNISYRQYRDMLR